MELTLSFHFFLEKYKKYDDKYLISHLLVVISGVYLQGTIVQEPRHK